MQVLRRNHAVIRCMFSYNHPEAIRRMDWSLEAETIVRGLLQLSWVIGFYLRQDSDVQGLCHAFYT